MQRGWRGISIRWRVEAGSPPQISFTAEIIGIANDSVNDSVGGSAVKLT